MTTSSPSKWLDSAFLRNGRAKQHEEIQGCQFLRSGIAPTVGQRVELTMFPKIQENRRPTVLISGHVVKVKPEPVDYFPMETLEDRKGSMMLSLMIGKAYANRSSSLPEGMSIHRCQCSDPACTNGALALIPRDIAAPKCQTVADMASQNLGAIHGQQVICEGRLHFDHDMRRGSADGPWADGIPFDGRDVWQFTVVFDDHEENGWVLKSDSFRNLGRNVRPRCWPWSHDDDLPCEHGGIDSDDINRDFPIQACIGPFGCTGEDHSHTFGGAAA